MAKSMRVKSAEASIDLPDEAADVIKSLPKEKQQIILKAISVQRHSGPLPDGETIRIYDEVIPDGGNRLMNTVESQLSHRFELEKEGLKRSFNQSSTGQWMAIVIALFFGFVSWDLAKSNHDAVASIIGGIDIVGLVAVFITGKFSKK